MVLSAVSLKAQGFYDLSAETIDGETFDFSELRGSKVMIVNTASKCGFTYQYSELQELYKKYEDKGFVLIAFPANNFANQEPGSNEEIKEFCSSKYSVSFPMMSKISVKGDDVHPVYQWLTQKSKNGVGDSEVMWNFQKYLIDENGKLVRVASTKESPLSEEITDWLDS